MRLNKQVELLDTPGILWPRFEDPQAGLRLAMIGSIKDEVVNREELALELLHNMLVLFLRNLKGKSSQLSAPELLEKDSHRLPQIKLLSLQKTSSVFCYLQEHGESFLRLQYPIPLCRGRNSQCRQIYLYQQLCRKGMYQDGQPSGSYKRRSVGAAE